MECEAEAVYSHLPCFFCNGSTPDNSEDCSRKSSLGHLFKYLELFSCNVNTNNANSSEEMSSILSICDRCSQMAEEFNELHHVLESTKMLLSRCLKRIHEVMTKAQLENGEKEEEDGDLRTTVMGKIKEISDLHLQPPTPPRASVEDGNDDFSSAALKDLNVAIPSANEDKIEYSGSKRVLPPADLESSETGTGSGCDHEQVQKRKRKKKVFRKTRASSSKEGAYICKCNKSFRHLSKARSHVRYHCPEGAKLPPPKPKHISLLTCAYCEYQCSDRRYLMNRHLIYRHMEMFFQSVRNDSSLTSSPWKDNNFKSIVTEIAFPKFISTETETDGISTSCSCSVCGKKYGKDPSFSQNRHQLTVHLINNHLQEVKEHLKEVMSQSDAQLQEQLDNANAFPMRNRSSKSKIDEDNEKEMEENDDIPASLLYGFSMWDTLMDLDVDETRSVLPNDNVPSPSPTY